MRKNFTLHVDVRHAPKVSRGFTVSCREMDGLRADGETPTLALRMFADALTLWTEDVLDNGSPLLTTPTPPEHGGKERK